jgi:hypothetical protein
MATKNLLDGLKGAVPRFILNPDALMNRKT